ncbi:MAG TPA: DinB family protein [Gemmataceae bacterium]|nr:DinB family protein [Gemmataceae bacterium]
MNAKEAIKTALVSTKEILGWYLSDLSDADLLVRPVPAANHIAWQLGHVISSESHLLGQLPGAQYPKLPNGWDDQHGKSGATMDPPKGFASKEEYLTQFNKAREATLAALAKMSDADLDKPTQGNMAQFAPTLGALIMLQSNHTLMHAGQFTVVRRKLGKPVLF